MGLLPIVFVFLLLNQAVAVDGQAAGGKDELATYRLAKVPADATNGLGAWVWTDKTFDRQMCRLWKEFEIPSGVKVTSARMKMTVDDGYQLFLDGRELGQGANWRALTEYDLTLLLTPGHHVLAVSGFNDYFQAGLIMDFEIRFSDGRTMSIKSDSSWRVVPETEEGWERMRHARDDWKSATVISGTNRASQWAERVWPYDYISVPRFRPLVIPFWQTVWFHVVLAFVGGLVVLACVWLSVQLAVHRKEQWLLNRERARIARDIHDDFGTRLTRLVLESEVGQKDGGTATESRARFARMGEGLREALQAMDEVLWAVNPRRDTVNDFVTYVCEYAQNFLQPGGIQCLLEVEPNMPALEFDLPLRRSLLLAVKEAINNAAKHSGASKLWLKIHRQESALVVLVEDDGKGFDPEQAGGRRHGIGNMAGRMQEVGGRCTISSQPGKGCQVMFTIPLTRRRHKRWLGENKPEKL